MNQSRNGIFTSSGIHNLMGTPLNQKKYIRDKRRELKLHAPINIEVTSHPLSWGRAIEGYVYEAHLDISYSLDSVKTIVHESGMFAGTPDLVGVSCIGDIKCPSSRSSFIDLSEICELKDPEVFKKLEPEYYWQLVSNGILLDKDFAELIVFMPYEKEIPDIIEYIELIDNFELQRDIQWVIHTDVSRIPHIPDNSGYNNIYNLKFEIPKKDKEDLLNKIEEAHNLKISF